MFPPARPSASKSVPARPSPFGGAGNVPRGGQQPLQQWVDVEDDAPIDFDLPGAPVGDDDAPVEFMTEGAQAAAAF